MNTTGRPDARFVLPPSPSRTSPSCARRASRNNHTGGAQPGDTITYSGPDGTLVADVVTIDPSTGK
jgi:hypothetical protein